MAATDLLTIEDAKLVVRRNPSHVQHTARLQAYVSAVSQKIDELVGPVVKRTVTAERHDDVCGEWLVLRRRPVTSITTVTSYQRGTSTVLTAESLVAAGGYLAEASLEDPSLLSGRLRRRANWYDAAWSTYGSTVAVTYEAGRYATTAAVAGTRYWEAAALTLKSVWRAEEATVSIEDDFYEPATAVPGFLVPRAAIELLADQLQHPNLVAV